MTIGISELNHPCDKVVQAGPACFILQSAQIVYSFSFQFYQVVLRSHSVLRSLLERRFWLPERSPGISIFRFLWGSHNCIDTQEPPTPPSPQPRGESGVNGSESSILFQDD